jgi:hypothetical protein
MAVACGADGGDPLKTPEDAASGTDGASGGNGSGDDGASSPEDATVGSSGSSSSGAGTSASSGSASSGSGSGSSGSASSSGSDASGTTNDGGAIDDVTIPLVDGAACLMDTGSCPVCATQNASDMPQCMQYLACYETSACNPHTSCGAMDAVCGVNTIGGGNAPQTAAIATYDCACH